MLLSKFLLKNVNFEKLYRDMPAALQSSNLILKLISRISVIAKKKTHEKVEFRGQTR